MFHWNWISILIILRLFKQIRKLKINTYPPEHIYRTRINFRQKFNNWSNNYSLHPNARIFKILKHPLVFISRVHTLPLQKGAGFWKHRVNRLSAARAFRQQLQRTMDGSVGNAYKLDSKQRHSEYPSLHLPGQHCPRLGYASMPRTSKRERDKRLDLWWEKRAFI